MGRLPSGARLYFWLVLSCAAVLLWQVNPFSGALDRESLVICLVIGIGLVMADTHPVEISHTTKLSASTALEFALLLLVGPALAIWTIVLSVAVTAHWHMRRAWQWYNVAFYAADGVVSVGVAGVLYQRAAGGAPLLSSPLSLLSLLMACAVYFLLNVGLVAIMVALARSSDSLGGFLSAFRMAAPQFAGLLALGVVGATVYTSSPLSAVLLLVPLLGVYLSLRSSLTLQAETKRALEALASEVDHYHPYTAQHSQRVAEYAHKIATRMRLGAEQVEMITRAARIHDVGKLTVWREMLNKPGRLTEQEMDEIRTHPSRGADLVGSFPDYRNGRDLVLYHHERYDGRGYPSGLRGEEIPLGARIIAVADAVDAMLSDRPYRRALTLIETMNELEHNRGLQFDPTVAKVMLEILAEEAPAGSFQGAWRAPVVV